MSNPQDTPGTPEYRRKLRDQTKQFDTEDIGASEEWQPADNSVSGETAGTAQTPSNFPTGEDTELPVNDE